jgi:hypothetical protein
MPRPENNENRNIMAQQIDFRPSLQSQLHTKTPNIGPDIEPNPNHSSHEPRLTVGSVDFRTEAKVQQRPKRPATSQPTAVQAQSQAAEILALAIKGEYQYGKLGLILGVMAILGGVILGLNGVAGSTSWTAKILGLESKINDAAPGVVLFVVGIFFVFITKPKVKLGDLKG